MISTPCLAFALRRESMFFRRAYPYRTRFGGAPCFAQFRGSGSNPFLLLETGIGSAAMEKALRWCLNRPRCGGKEYRPDFVWSLGFSGALTPAHRVGDVIMATEIVDSSGRIWPCHDVALEGVSKGRLFCSSEIVSTPAEKRRLGDEWNALAVDVESEVVARACKEQEIPFACLRVISDEVHTALSSHLVDLLRNQSVSLPRLGRCLLKHPRLFSELWRLARDTRLAARRLQAVFSSWNASRSSC